MGKSFDSLRYVDSVLTNPAQPTYLFRGGSPVDNGTFDYADLVAAIHAPTNPPPTPVPDRFYLLVVTLLNANEGGEIGAELGYFAAPANAGSGEVHWWETMGTSQCYFQTPPGARDALVATLDQWLPDPIIWRVAQLRAWLSTPPASANGLPLVIYVHCDGGCDRTGEMIGAYMLRYMGMNWMDMYEANHPCVLTQRNGQKTPWYPGCNNYRTIQWYAFWLNTQSFGLPPVTGVGNDHGCLNGSSGVQKVCAPSGS